MTPPSGDTVTPEGLTEEAKAERDYKGRALISFSFSCKKRIYIKQV